MEELSDNNHSCKKLRLKEDNNTSELTQLEIEIEQKKDTLLRLQAELQKQEDYNTLKKQYE